MKQLIGGGPIFGFLFCGLAFAESAYDLGMSAKIDGDMQGSIEDYKTAIKHFTQAIKDEPKNGLVYTVRGDTYGKLGDYKSAIADYTQAIKLNPNDGALYNNRATLYGQSGDLKNAEKDARKACEMKVCNALNFMDQNGMLGK
jgi:Flp pilus assembly protein TadD